MTMKDEKSRSVSSWIGTQNGVLFIRLKNFSLQIAPFSLIKGIIVLLLFVVTSDVIYLNLD